MQFLWPFPFFPYLRNFFILNSFYKIAQVKSTENALTLQKVSSRETTGILIFTLLTVSKQFIHTDFKWQSLTMSLNTKHF